MTTTTADVMTAVPEAAVGRFLDLLRTAADQGTLVKLVLGKYRGSEPGLRNVRVRPVILKGAACWSFVYRYETRDITRNLPVAEGLATVATLLGGDFRSGNLFGQTANAQIEFNKKGHATLGVSKSTGERPPAPQHDRPKERLIDPARPFLKALGVTQAGGQVFPSMARKWKQINVFLDHFRGALLASRTDRDAPVTVMDFGCGKGYLTFAVYDCLTHGLGLQAQVTGVEIRNDLVTFCRATAAALGMEGLRFETGSLTDHAAAPVQVLIALHACDTATDLAIHRGVRSGAEIILCAPCCHKELRPQMVAPPPLDAMLRFGVHLGQEAEMVTDTLRALWLESAGYEVQVFEFIAPEHTSKNKMIQAVRRGKSGSTETARRQLAALKAFYGIETFALERLESAAWIVCPR